MTQRRSAQGSTGTGSGSASAGHAGQSSQADQAPVESNSAQAVEIAEQAIEGGGSELPFLDRIARSFGQHDVSDARAHHGPVAEAATSELGALAFAWEEDVVFGESPDLFTAAHEAAHVAGVDDEGHADEVADRVVAGESAAALIDQYATSPGTHGEVRLRRDNAPQKEVSGRAMARLSLAQQAIDHTQSIFTQGGGNQLEALRDSKFNSYFRMQVMRDMECWTLHPDLVPLARQYPEALTAAQADLAAGGNCGENAMVAFDLLRRIASSEQVNRVAVSGLDHAFVILGDIQSAEESDSDLVVADPWPTEALACTWDDHFAFTPSRGNIQIHNQVSGDDTDVKSALAAGLSLSPKGEEMINWVFDEERTEQEIEKGRDKDSPWIWQHPDAHAQGRGFEYFTNEPTQEAPAAQAPEAPQQEAPELSAPEQAPERAPEPEAPITEAPAPEVAAQVEAPQDAQETVRTDVPTRRDSEPAPTLSQPEPMVRTEGPEAQGPTRVDVESRRDTSVVSDEEATSRLSVAEQAAERARIAREERERLLAERIAAADAARQAAIERQRAGRS